MEDDRVSLLLILSFKWLDARRVDHTLTISAHQGYLFHVVIEIHTLSGDPISIVFLNNGSIKLITNPLLDIWKIGFSIQGYWRLISTLPGSSGDISRMQDPLGLHVDN